MTLANWRDLAVVLLAVEAFFMALVPGAVLYLMIRGMLWVIKQLRHYAPIVQSAFRKVERNSDRLSRRAVDPIIRINSLAARAPRWSQIRSASSPQQHEV